MGYDPRTAHSKVQPHHEGPNLLREAYEWSVVEPAANRVAKFYGHDFSKLEPEIQDIYRGVAKAALGMN